MAANRRPIVAPAALLSLSKTTLADVAWELAAVAPGVECCDDPGEIMRVIREAVLQVRAPSADLRVVERERDRYLSAARERGGAT